MKPHAMTVKRSDQVLELEIEATLLLCENIGSSRALAVHLLIRHGEWLELLKLSCDPNNYTDAEAFADDYLVTSILQKNPRLPTGIDREEVAIAKFWEFEERCSEANQRLEDWYKGTISVPSDVSSCLFEAQKVISQILGPLTRSKLSFAESRMRFGPGATTSLSGVVTQGKKYSHRPLDVTPRALAFRTFCFPEMWKQSCVNLNVRRSSKMRVVPKNAKTDRTICIEPDLNIFGQLGFGALIREQLRIFGVDLNTQSTNQVYASMAWELDLCTMDLSGASDSVCREAVWFLLPYCWADVLHFFRTDYVEYEGKDVELSKWSSMGNGYTFELETLIFLGIITAACRQLELPTDWVTAYGDDLIFPEAARDLVQRTLDFLGFKVNGDKTFGKGVFHESCGTDWFEGKNVRPIYFRSESDDFPTTVYTMANSLTTWALRFGGVEKIRDKRILPSWLRCFTALHRKDRHHIPYGYGDVGFYDSLDRSCPSTHDRDSRGWNGWNFLYRKVPPLKKRISEEGSYLSFLNGNSSEFSLARESLRGRFGPAVTKKGYSLEWPHLGPWA